MKPDQSDSNAHVGSEQAAPSVSTIPVAAQPPSGEGQKPVPKRSDPPAIDHPLERLLALGVLLGIIQFWAERHLSLSLLEKVAGTPLLAVLIPFLAALVDFFAGKTAKKGFQTWLRKKAVAVLKTPVLGLLFVIVLVAGSMVSSVTVQESGAHVPLQVSVHRESVSGSKLGTPNGSAQTGSRSKTLDETSQDVRLLLMTNPFGAACVVEAEGYQPYFFDLYPWIGRRVRVDRDLEFAPSVLIRVPLGRHALLPGGRIELWSAGKKLAESNTAELRGSVLFGRDLPLEGRRLVDWEHELRMSGAEAGALSRGYLAWRRPLVVALKPALEPRMELEARFVSRNDETQASAKFTVTAEPLLDILLSEGRNDMP